MIVERMTYEVPSGSRERFVELLRELRQWTNRPPDRPQPRVYLPISGNRERVVVEFVFDSWEAREKAWAGAEAVPESFWDRWDAVLISATPEFFTLVE
jgi:hypothetical protein